MMTRVLSAVVLAFLVSDVTLFAQADPIALAPGARVRVQQGPETLTGTLVSSDGAGLVVVTDKSDTVPAPLGSITTVEMSTGKRSHARMGAVIGLGMGFVTGIVVSMAAPAPQPILVASSTSASSDNWTAGAGVAGAVLGAGIGAIVGAVTRSEKWAPAVPPTIGIRGHGPDAKRVDVGLKIPF
jgi:hypothetical protein